MEPRAKIESNLGTCKRGSPLIKLMVYERLEDAVGVWEAGNAKHIHTHTHTVSPVIHKLDGASGNDRKHI